MNSEEPCHEQLGWLSHAQISLTPSPPGNISRPLCTRVHAQGRRSQQPQIRGPVSRPNRVLSGNLTLKELVPMSTQIDPQVTESITQTSPQFRGGAPAAALGNLYQATAHALGNAAQIAVNSQQQNDILMQAATTQAVMQLLSIDSTGNVASLNEGKSSGATRLTEDLADALSKIERVVESPSKHGIDNDSPWSHAAREMMHTVADTLREFQRVSQETGMAMVKQAAIAAVLVRLINAPDQLQQYQKILELIEGLSHNDLA